MRLHRFIGDFDLSTEQLIVQDADLASQLSHVLRLKEKDPVILCDGKGQEAVAKISSLRKTSAAFRLEELRRVVAEPERVVTLYCSILKRENFELVAQKATEAGVRSIVPIHSKRTVKQDINPIRISKIMREAAEQSGRGRVPELFEPKDFSDAIDTAASTHGTVVFLRSIRNTADRGKKSNKVALFIGPEEDGIRKRSIGRAGAAP